MSLKGIGFKDVEWIHVAQNWVLWWDIVCTVMNFWIP